MMWTIGLNGEVIDQGGKVVVALSDRGAKKIVDAHNDALALPAIHPERTMFLRVHVGTATGNNDESSFEMSLANGTNPLIESKQSGRWAAFDWELLLTLALAAGLDDTDA